MSTRVAWFARQRFARVLGAFRKAATLTGHHAKIIVCVGVAGLKAQYLSVTRNRVRDGATPVQRQPLLQQITHRQNGHPAPSQTIPTAKSPNILCIHKPPKNNTKLYNHSGPSRWFDTKAARAFAVPLNIHHSGVSLLQIAAEAVSVEQRCDPQ